MNAKKYITTKPLPVLKLSIFETYFRTIYFRENEAGLDKYNCCDREQKN